MPDQTVSIEEPQPTEPINPSCTICGDFRGGALGHTAEQCEWSEEATEKARAARWEAEQAREARGAEVGPPIAVVPAEATAQVTP